MTLWPDSVLPRVGHQLCPRFEVDPDSTIKWIGVGETSELADEWVLRVLLDADLEDDATVMRLLKDGAILRPFQHPDHVASTDAQARMALTQSSSSGHSLGSNSSDRARATLEDCRWWLKAAQALTGICVSAEGDNAPDHGVWESLGFRPGYAAVHPWTRFVDYLNLGLDALGPRATVRTYGIDYGNPTVDLYGAACVQIFNLIVSDETIRRCASQTCGRPFAKQINDQQEHRLHYRSDARYCTDRCARAEAARQYRRRRSADRKKEQ